MIATHFKEHMNYLIWPKQCSFILSRQGIDYVIIMKEVFHSMQTMWGKIDCVATKVGLDKAYDIISWVFLKDTSGDVGFSYDFCQPHSSMCIDLNYEHHF